MVNLPLRSDVKLRLAFSCGAGLRHAAELAHCQAKAKNVQGKAEDIREENGRVTYVPFLARKAA